VERAGKQDTKNAESSIISHGREYIDIPCTFFFDKTVYTTYTGIRDVYARVDREFDKVDS